MKPKYITYFCPYVIMHDRYRRNGSRGCSTLCASLSSFPREKRLRNSYLHNNSISFDNSRCMWKLVVQLSLSVEVWDHLVAHTLDPA